MLLIKQDDNPFSHAKSFHKADAGTVICSGVSIGENTVIGAGSVVVKDIPPDSVDVGIHAESSGRLTTVAENTIIKTKR